MINTVKDYEKLSEQYNKMLEERNTLIDDLSWYRAKVIRLEREIEDREKSHIELYCDKKSLHDENKKLEHERDYYNQRYRYIKEVCSELEREIKDFDKDYEMVTTNCIYWEDKAHWLEDESSKYIDLLSEISQHIGNKPASSTYKYFRAQLDDIGIKVGE